MMPTVVLRLFLVPGSADLAGIELEMSQENRREFLLARNACGQRKPGDGQSDEPSHGDAERERRLRSQDYGDL